MLPLLIALHSPSQEALLQQAAAAIDVGRPELAAGLARAAVEIAPDTLMAPAGLALLSLAEQRQRDPMAALAATLERLERFGEGSEWAAQSPAHALAAMRDAADLERDLRLQTAAVHVAGKDRAMVEARRRAAAQPASEDDPPFYGCRLIDNRSPYFAVAAGAPAFHACATAARRANPELAGTIGLRFTVSPDGQLSDAQVERDTVGDPALAACVLDELERLPFADDGVSVRVVRIPLVFPAEP